MACLAAGGSACCSEQSLKMRPVFLKIDEIRRDRLGPKEKTVLFIKKIGTVKKMILFIKKSVKKSGSATSILTTQLNF
jgi:hypothetical protein